jgi:hypothetical protein
MVTSNRLPTIGRVGSRGGYYRDELVKGEKKLLRRKVRRAERKAWRNEYEI